MGHVNNAVFFTYLEIARNEYWFRVVGGSSERDLGFILARAEDEREELHAGVHADRDEVVGLDLACDGRDRRGRAPS